MNKPKIKIGLIASIVLLGCTSEKVARQLEIERIENEVRREMGKLVEKEQFLEACQYRCPQNGKAYLDEAAERERNIVLTGTVYPKWTEWHREKLNSEVSRLVSAHKYGEAREFIWQYGNVGVSEVDVQVDTIRYQLLAEKVNVVELDFMKKDLEATYQAAVEAGSIPALVAAKHKIAAYPEVRTYSSMLDGSLDSVRDALISVKVPSRSLNPILTQTKRMIADCFVDRKADTKEKQGPDLAGSRLRLAEFQADLLKYGCNAQQAEKVANTFEAKVKPLLDEAVRKAKGGPDLIALGTSSVNDKAKKIQSALVEKIDALVMSNLTARLVADVKSVLNRKDLAVDDFPALRTRLLKSETIGDIDLDAQYLVLRIGILNTLVNPVQCQMTLDEMNEVMKRARANAKDANELLKAYHRLAVLAPASDDNAYGDLLACLNKIGETLKNLDVGERTASEFVRRKTRQLIEELNGRTNTYVGKTQYDMHPLIEMLNGYETALRRHFETTGQNYPARCKGMIWNEVNEMLRGKRASMTTETMIGHIGKRWYACTAELMPMLKTAEEKQKNAEMAKRLREAQEKDEREKLEKLEQQKKEWRAKLGRLDAEWLQQIALGRIDTNGGNDPRGKDRMNALLGEYVRLNRKMAMLLAKKGDEEGLLVEFLKKNDVFTTLLDGAIYLGLGDQFELLLDFRIGTSDGDDSIDINGTLQADPLRRTPLLLALEFGRMDMLDVLTGNKTLSCDWNARDVRGDGVAHYAAMSGNALILETINTTIDVCQTNDMGRTALYVAVQKDNPRLVNALVQRGTNSDERVRFVNWRDARGITPFALACSNGCARAMETLAEWGAAYGAEDLRVAASADRLTAVRWLVESGCVSVNSTGVMEAAPAGSQTEEYLVRQGGVRVKRPESDKVQPKACGKAKYVLCEISDDDVAEPVQADDGKKGKASK